MWVGVGAVYLLTLSENMLWDPVIYAHIVEKGAWRSILNPHHPLALLPGGLAYQTLKALGLQIRSMEVLQVTSAMFSSLAVAIFFINLRSLGVQSLVALEGALLFAVSLATWQFSVEADVHSFGATVLGLAFGAAISFRHRPTAKRAMWAGAAGGLAILAHQVNVAFAGLAMLLLVWRTRQRVADVVSYFLSGTLVSMAGYLAIGCGALGLWQPREFIRWWTGYLARASLSGWQGSSKYALRGAVLGAIRAVAYVPRKVLFQQLARGELPGASDVLVLVLFGIVGLSFLAGGLCLARHMRQTWKQYPLIVPFCLAWFVSLSLVAIWWDAAATFWMLILSPFWTLVSLLLDSSVQRAERRAAWAVGSAMLASLFLLNLFGTILPAHDVRSNTNLRISYWVGENTLADDAVIVPHSALISYLPYYGERPNVLDMFDSFRKAKGGQENGYRRLNQRIEGLLLEGRRVFLVSQAMTLSPRLASLMGTDSQSVETFFHSHYRMSPVADLTLEDAVVNLYQLEGR